MRCKLYRTCNPSDCEKVDHSRDTEVHIWHQRFHRSIQMCGILVRSAIIFNYVKLHCIRKNRSRRRRRRRRRRRTRTRTRTLKRVGSVTLTCGTSGFQARSPPRHYHVASTTTSLEKTSLALTYHLAEGINADVQSANVGVHSAWRKAEDRSLWRRIIDTPTFQWRHDIDEWIQRQLSLLVI